MTDELTEAAIVIVWFALLLVMGSLLPEGWMDMDSLAENVKLREFASEAFSMAFKFYHGAGTAEDLRELTVEYRELIDTRKGELK